MSGIKNNQPTPHGVDPQRWKFIQEHKFDGRINPFALTVAEQKALGASTWSDESAKEIIRLVRSQRSGDV